MAAAFWGVARRPRWIGALILALALAAGFAALGQWQLSRSFQTAAVVGTSSETTVPLTSIAQPATSPTDPQLGQKVTVDGALVPGDFVVLSGRDNGHGQGYWLVGHLRTTGGASLAVALGWAPDAATATNAAATAALAGTVTGRYLPSESPTQSDFEHGALSALAVADLVNRWPDALPMYSGYVVVDTPVAGLAPILSPAPDRGVSLNLLNVFYAIEWVVFAGMAFYLWYRLVMDVVEREAEEAEEQAAAAEHPAPGANVG